MGGWLWIILGGILYTINTLPPYQRWALQRLKGKNISQPEQKLFKRKQMLNLLAFAYILAGFALLMSQ